ncbi:hypothetical protein V5735_07185 (plasmid) [Haladaptatus sp. SPP-AMP-3]|uniref:hypothetical protein n=1 Tax=Haladaptatus sp. SPP-AMP-3 TaxID=3121295 RepID=UPI003C2C05EB
MKITPQRDTEATNEPSIEETRYGPPQHSMRRTDPEERFYGAPQHETDVAVDSEPRESRAYLWWWEASVRRDRPHRPPGRRPEVASP